MALMYILLFISIITYPLPTVRIGGQPLAIFLALYALVYFLYKGFAKRVDLKTLWPLWALPLGFLISSMASGTFNLNYLVNVVAFYAIYFVLANISGNSYKIVNVKADSTFSYRVMLNVLILTGVILGLYGYYGYITGKVGTDTQYFWWESARYWGIHYTGSTRNADIHYIVFPFIAVLAKRNKKVMDIGLILFFGSAVILSMARNTWLCILIVLVIFLLMQKDTKKKMRLIFIVIGMLCIGYLMLQYFGMLDYFVAKLVSIFSMQGTDTVSNSNSERWSIIVATLEIIFANPLGVGAECLSAFYHKRGFFLNHAENTYLNITAEMGIIAAIGYVSLVFTPIRKMKMASREKQLNEGENFVLLSSIYFASTILFNTETINCYMWIILGIIWFVMTISSNEKEEVTWQ